MTMKWWASSGKNIYFIVTLSAHVWLVDDDDDVIIIKKLKLILIWNIVAILNKFYGDNGKLLWSKAYLMNS